ncbi:membrane protein [Streptomyces phage MulchMansion]|nr:membrane protein [Streptomyces phage MulchMansion]UVK61254.1 membrane protein [Streptomyces phage Angela]
MTDTTKTADEMVSNATLVKNAVWAWLAKHPAVIATLFFILGFMIG